MVQVIAGIIIRNTSADSERDDFWSKAEANLLMALLHYVRILTYPHSDKPLPPEERSRGAIHRLIATTSVNELDACFRARPPYGIFRKAPRNIHGNIMMGLVPGLADDITKQSGRAAPLQLCVFLCDLRPRRHLPVFVLYVFRDALLDNEDLSPLDEAPTIPIGRDVDLRQGIPAEISLEDNGHIKNPMPRRAWDGTRGAGS